MLLRKILISTGEYTMYINSTDPVGMYISNIVNIFDIRHAASALAFYYLVKQFISVKIMKFIKFLRPFFILSLFNYMFDSPLLKGFRRQLLTQYNYMKLQTVEHFWFHPTNNFIYFQIFILNFFLYFGYI